MPEPIPSPDSGAESVRKPAKRPADVEQNGGLQADALAGKLPDAARSPEEDSSPRYEPPLPLGLEKLNSASIENSPEVATTTNQVDAPYATARKLTLVAKFTEVFRRFKIVAQCLAGVSCFSLGPTFAQPVRDLSAAGGGADISSTMNPGLFGVIRNTVSAACLLKHAWKALPHVRMREVLTAALGGATNTLFIAGMLWTEPSSLVALHFTFPVLLATAAWAKGAKPSAGQLTATALTCGAVGLLFSHGAASGAASMLGNLAALGTAVSWAAYLSLVKHCRPKAAPALGFMSNAIGAGLSLGLVGLVPAGLGNNPLLGVSMAAANGLFAGAAFHLITLAARKLSAARVGFLSLLEIPLAPTIPLLLFGTPIPRVAAIAGLLTLAAAALEFGATVKDIRGKAAADTDASAAAKPGRD